MSFDDNVDLVHAILGIRPPAEEKRLAMDSQGRMDQIDIMRRNGKGSVHPDEVIGKNRRMIKPMPRSGR